MFRSARERNFCNNSCLLPLFWLGRKEKYGERELLIKQKKFINKGRGARTTTLIFYRNKCGGPRKKQFLSVMIPLLHPLAEATCSRKHTHSGGQCRPWSAVHHTGGPKAETPLSQGPQPGFLKPFYTLIVHAQIHLPKFPETSLNKGKERCNQS